ncbi:S49 family peptidase [Halobellus rufus]|uniref:S49 family peptidase n=1 Tax=Halobellus rufus TaxID=1448860 RepID=UPI000678DB4B|nr:S49 family peptidase [Halobellus rufus]
MSRRLSSTGRLVVVAAVVGLLVGGAVAPGVWERTTAPDGQVAVIEMHSTVTADTATTVVDNLREARQNESIQAVVLDVNSPGGSAAASEQLYLAVKRTEQVMPVVVSVSGMAASGSYYMSAPADEIYVTPASSVGSIGVRATLPAGGVPSGQVVTGPDKGSTATEAEVRQQVETLRRAFVGSVVAERDESLALTRSEISYAKVYSGARSIELGLADSIGGSDTAIAAAAERAGMSDYAVTRMESPQPNLLSQLGLEAESAAETSGVHATFGNHGTETVHYLMLHGSLDVPREVTHNASR